MTPAHAGRRGLLTGLAGTLGMGRLGMGTLGVGTAVRGQAAIDPGLLDIRRYVYVPVSTSPDVTIIDSDTDRIFGSLPIGLLARHVVISRETATLIATDGRSGEVVLAHVLTGVLRRVVLEAPVDRLTIGASGRMAAATQQAGGTITLIDLDDARVDRVISGLPPLRDVMFGEQDTVLYIAAEGLGGIGVINVARARLAREIAPFRPSRAGFAALARTPNGRRLLAQPQGGGPISVLDPEQGEPIAELAAGTGTVGMFPSGTGAFLLIPDNASATLAIFRAERLDEPVALHAASDVAGVHTAWLDSVAFVPCAGSRRLLVYDLDQRQPAGEIALAGTPAPGAVTPDSRTLYLPILDPAQVVAVDGATRRIVASFDLPTPPLAALVAGGWGICH